MNQTTTDTETMGTRGRRPMTPIVKLLLAALLVDAVLFIVQQVVSFGAFFPPVGIIQATVALVLAGIVAIGWRWAPALASGLYVLAILANFLIIVQDLANPGAVFDFVFTIIALSLALIVIVAGIAATMKNRRHAS